MLKRLERAFSAQTGEFDDKAICHRWSGQTGWQPITHPHEVPWDSLLHIDTQRDQLEANTCQFLAGRPANNALLWGSRGTGKSSLIKALLGRYADQGLRLIEVEPADLPAFLHALDGTLRDRSERFILFVDDLSFEAGDPSYKALKALLDGSVQRAPDNLLIYATSNRRHLMPEPHADNAESRLVDGEIHHGDAVEEKISLSDRFGLWLSFYPFAQDEYLDMVRGHVVRLGGDANADDLQAEALRWALGRGSRSGRTAEQFARHWVGSRAD